MIDSQRVKELVGSWVRVETLVRGKKTVARGVLSFRMMRPHERVGRTNDVVAVKSAPLRRVCCVENKQYQYFFALDCLHKIT